MPVKDYVPVMFPELRGDVSLHVREGTDIHLILEQEKFYYRNHISRNFQSRFEKSFWR